MGMVLAGLRWLASADLASAPSTVQADCLRDLERATSMQTAVRASVLQTFCAKGGYEDDGHGSPRTWLAWQTRITRPAANAALASMRRLAAHPAVAEALAEGVLSASWARQVTEWTDLLPEEARADADVILLAAAAGGADLADLADLAEEMRRRLASPDSGGDGFDERSLRLDTTLGGAGRLDGDLTPRCTAALQAVLDSLGKKAGPEDTRTCAQRRHDALEEACRRLLASACLPDRAGQPVRLQLNINLDELARAGGDDCDASVAPIVTGRVDNDLLDRLAAEFGGTASRSRAAARQVILGQAIDLLSGPGGLASLLRTGTLPGPAGSISLPLDLGTPTEVIPPHLRRAVIARDRLCRFPGCDQAPAACQVHHITPRSKAGLTKLSNLLLLCSFHHLILVHQWGWAIALNPDGTVTATSPRGRVLHSHGPPAAAA